MKRCLRCNPADLDRSILGCGDGPASFNAEWTEHGGEVTSFDPVYAFADAQISARFDAVAPHRIDQFRRQSATWRWTSHRDVEHLEACRGQSLATFLEDCEAGTAAGHYREATLPELPFNDQQFDLWRCARICCFSTASCCRPNSISKHSRKCVAPLANCFYFRYVTWSNNRRLICRPPRHGWTIAACRGGFSA